MSNYLGYVNLDLQIKHGCRSSNSITASHPRHPLVVGGAALGCDCKGWRLERKNAHGRGNLKPWDQRAWGFQQIFRLSPGLSVVLGPPQAKSILLWRDPTQKPRLSITYRCLSIATDFSRCCRNSPDILWDGNWMGSSRDSEWPEHESRRTEHIFAPSDS